MPIEFDRDSLTFSKKKVKETKKPTTRRKKAVPMSDKAPDDSSSELPVEETKELNEETETRELDEELTSDSSS